MRRLALLASLPVLLLSACGGDAAGGDDGPAGLAPANAQLYVEAIVRPEGDLREDVLEAVRKVSGSDDPAAEIERLLEETSEGEDFDYQRDVEPWLGERVGVWSADLQSDDPGFALIAETTDADEAITSLRESAEREDEKVTERSYEGTDYLVNEDEETVAGLVDDMLVMGSEPEFKRTVDAAGEDTLADADRFTEIVADLDEDRLATVWIDQRSLFAALKTETADSDFQVFDQIFDVDKLQPVAAGVVADGERIAIESVGSTEGNVFGNRLSAFSGATTEMLGELPGDAWIAFGFPEAGEAAAEIYRKVAGALGGAALEQQFRQQTGLDLQEDVFGWIGDVAVYASGVGEAELGGALVIGITDSGKATNAFGKIAGLVRTQAAGAEVSPVDLEGAESAFEIADPELPQSLVLARAEERMVLAYGRAAAEQALAPDETLAESDLWSRAEEVLEGDLQPSFVLDMTKVLENVDAFGGGDDEGFAQARKYMEAFDVITSGGEVSDDQQTGRFAAGLK